MIYWVLCCELLVFNIFGGESDVAGRLKDNEKRDAGIKFLVIFFLFHQFKMTPISQFCILKFYAWVLNEFNGNLEIII
jgi:hypothetical protein